jgi:hypothetical protein
MGFWTFVLAVSVVSIVGGIVNTWIKARHGYPLESDDKRSASKSKMDAICAENHDLKQRLTEVTDRLAVLERIATDPAARVAHEIEQLR